MRNISLIPMARVRRGTQRMLRPESDGPPGLMVGAITISSPLREIKKRETGL
jgi:hypothetical protein